MLCGQEKFKKTCYVQYEYCKIHKQMSDQRAHDNTVRCKQKTRMKTVPAHNSGIYSYKSEQRQILTEIYQNLLQPFEGRIEIQKTTGGKDQEIQYQSVIIVVQINEFNIKKNEYYIKRTEQPDNGFLLCRDMAQPYKGHIEPVRQDYREQDKEQKQDILIFVPELGKRRNIGVKYIIQTQKDKNRCTGESHFIEAFYKRVMYISDLPDLYGIHGYGSLSSFIVCLMPCGKKNDRQDTGEAYNRDKQERSCLCHIKVVNDI